MSELKSRQLGFVDGEILPESSEQLLGPVVCLDYAPVGSVTPCRMSRTFVRSLRSFLPWRSAVATIESGSGSNAPFPVDCAAHELPLPVLAPASRFSFAARFLARSLASAFFFSAATTLDRWPVPFGGSLFRLDAVEDGLVHPLPSFPVNDGRRAKLLLVPEATRALWRSMPAAWMGFSSRCASIHL